MNCSILKEENDKIFYDVLNKLFFRQWLNSKSFHKKIELFITAKCNLKCEYCYLNRFGDLLYPSEISKENCILDNISKILKWINRNGYMVNDISLFSGEIWHTDFGVQVLEILYNELKSNKYMKSIIIPTNGSFVLYDNYSYQISEYIEKFSNIGIKLLLSFSVDGLPVEPNSRQSKESKDYESFYNKLFKFYSEHSKYIGFHPMIAACNSDKFIETYEWWKQKEKEYNITKTRFLEVRNPDWTKYDLKKYIDFIEYYFYSEYRTQKNIEIFINNILGVSRRGSSTFFLENYGDRFTCSFQSTLTIRCGDLSIVPCHRMSYDKFVAGKLVIDNDGNLENVMSNNCEFYLKSYLTNPNLSQIKCDTCKIAPLCCKGCIGAQYEYFKEPFSPIINVCNMIKCKIYTLIFLLNKEGLLEYISKMDFNSPSGYPLTNIYFDICKIIESDEYKKYEEYKRSKPS